MNFFNGLLSGLSPPSTAPQMSGLLGQFYDPKEMKRQQMKQMLLGAGIGLLSQQGRVGAPITWGESLGDALRGGMQGAQSAEQSYMNNAKMAYEMDRNAKDDTWKATEREHQLTQWRAEEKAKKQRDAQIMQIVKDLSPEQQAAALAAPDVFLKTYNEHMFPNAPEMTTDERNFNAAQKNPAFGQFLTDKTKAGAATNNIMGNIPPGYQVDYDQQGRPVRMVPIPGSPAAIEADQANQKGAAQTNRKMTMTDTIVGAADNARKLIGATTTGPLGQVLSGVGITNAAEVNRQVNVLKSNATIENLNAMRRESPTGGALGNVTAQENAMLANAAGALDPSAGPARFNEQLNNYELTLLRIVHGYDEGTKIFNETRKTGTAEDQGVPEGVDPVEWQHMTPKEKALWPK